VSRVAGKGTANGDDKAAEEVRPGPPEGRRLAILSLAALGVVYGDIGTSPLYALRECFHGEYGIAASRAHVLGVLSLMFWSLVLVVALKYLTLILRADNNGEGGVIALMALVTPSRGEPVWHRRVLIALGLFGASLLYGDGMITPSISVLSAVEGLGVAAPRMVPWVVPATILILIVLFAVQRHGTGRVGSVFGPVTLGWFVVLAILGARGIARGPQVLAAFNPAYGASFLLHGGSRGFMVLGAVFLVVTGAEALYADMGHFGRRPIRLAWYGVVLPALLVNYFGQGALVLRNPETAHHPFYALVPSWALYPVVALATAATIIASQAVISGAFSLTRQAIQLGYCPRLEIVHTTSDEIGQIYIPRVNWILLLATVALVLAFGSSSRLAAAYGVAVTTTMTIATLLFYVVARERWKWGLLKAGVPALAFLCVDLSFFGANIGKIAHGAWFPLVIGLAVYGVLTTWKRGRDILGERWRKQAVGLEEFLAGLEEEAPARVPGRAVYMTGNPDLVPPALLLNLKHNKVLHEEVVFLTVETREVPRVAPRARVELEELGHGFHRLRAAYGFMEDPDVPHVLRIARRRGLAYTLPDTSFFLGREAILASGRSGMPSLREKLFAFLSRNALGATAFYRLPPAQVVELGAQIQL
jgi:KUP system potassium uptake protein